LHAVIGVFSLQGLELPLDLRSGPPLCRAKDGNELGSKCQIPGSKWQPFRLDFLTVITLH
jgi:hypothetical protein